MSFRTITDISDIRTAPLAREQHDHIIIKIIKWLIHHCISGKCIPY